MPARFSPCNTNDVNLPGTLMDCPVRPEALQAKSPPPCVTLRVNGRP